MHGVITRRVRGCVSEDVVTLLYKWTPRLDSSADIGLHVYIHLYSP